MFLLRTFYECFNIPYNTVAEKLGIKQTVACDTVYKVCVD
jgi:hypothetical protein